MSDYDKFMAAIIEDPEDDVRRLAFADWLQENGKVERAEFIRVQIELWHIDHRIDSGRAECRCPKYIKGPFCDWCKPGGEGTRYMHLNDREYWLFQWHGRSWFCGLPGSYPNMVEAVPRLKMCEGWEYVVTRGFVSEVKCRGGVWLGDEVPCDVCEDQAADWETNVVECQSCDSTGALSGEPAIGPTIMMMQPVTNLVITDLEDMVDELLGDHLREGELGPHFLDFEGAPDLSFATREEAIAAVVPTMLRQAKLEAEKILKERMKIHGRGNR